MRSFRVQGQPHGASHLLALLVLLSWSAIIPATGGNVMELAVGTKSTTTTKGTNATAISTETKKGVAPSCAAARMPKTSNCMYDHSDDSEGGKGSTCGLLFSLPFSDKRKVPSFPREYGLGKWTPKKRGTQGLGLMAAGMLAVEHFNTRNPVVVPQLEEMESCSFQFTDVEFLDSGSIPEVAVPSMTAAATAAASESESSSFCAMIGPTNLRTIQATAPLAAHNFLPQVTVGSVHSELNDDEYYPSVVRNAIDMAEMASALASYLDWKGRNFVAMIHDRDWGSRFLRSLYSPLSKRGVRLFHHSVTHRSSNPTSEIRRRLKLVKERGLHTIILALEYTSLISLVAREAVAAGVVGDDYLWILIGEDDAVISVEYLTRLTDATRTNPPPPVSRDDGNYDDDDYGVDWNYYTAQLLRGAGLLHVMSHGTPSTTNMWQPPPLTQLWSQQNATLARKLNQASPLRPHSTAMASSAEFVVASDDFFQTHPIPPDGASYVYDAVMAVGLTACRVRQQQHVAPQDLEGITSDIVQTKFQGASSFAMIAFEEGTKSRASDSVSFGMYNIRFSSQGDYSAVLSSFFYKSLWTDLDDEFIYYDGTADPPQPVLEAMEEHFLSSQVQYAGLFLMAVSLFLYFVCVIWTFGRRRHRLVRASQPVFLYLLCAGSSLVSLTIFFLSFDESYGWTDAELDAACMAAPWFFVVGYIVIYSALFMKLWRVNRILQFARRKIQVRQVLSPFVILLGASVAVLTAWTIMDPWQWERVVLEEVPLETFGECASKSGREIRFLAPIAVLMVCPTVLTATMAWKTKDVSEDLAEGDLIFYGIFAQIQTWVVGLPILLMLEGRTPDAIYLGRVLLITTFAVVSIVLLLAPKVWMVEFRSIVVAPETVSTASVMRRGSLGGVFVTGIENSLNFIRMATPVKGSEIDNRVGDSNRSEENHHQSDDSSTMRQLSSSRGLVEEENDERTETNATATLGAATCQGGDIDSSSRSGGDTGGSSVCERRNSDEETRQVSLCKRRNHDEEDGSS